MEGARTYVSSVLRGSRREKSRGVGTGKGMLPEEEIHKTLGGADQNRGQDHFKPKHPLRGWACPVVYF